MKVRAEPTCRKPVGEGANRTRSISDQYKCFAVEYAAEALHRGMCTPSGAPPSPLFLRLRWECSCDRLSGWLVALSLRSPEQRHGPLPVRPSCDASEASVCEVG